MSTPSASPAPQPPMRPVRSEEILEKSGSKPRPVYRIVTGAAYLAFLAACLVAHQVFGIPFWIVLIAAGLVSVGPSAIQGIRQANKRRSRDTATTAGSPQPESPRSS